MSVRQCPALLVTAPASGQGKTTVTAALARLHARQGRRVRVFKCGPDFLDPMILQRASGHPVRSLDLWMVGEAECRRQLWNAAGDADLILVEGVMGLFDGQPSSADLAGRLGLPVLAVIDASAMAQTFAAIAHGLASFRPGLDWAGVLANRVGSARHAALLRAALPATMRWFGALPRETSAALPSRHLGLIQADELMDLDQRLDAAADALAASADISLPPICEFAEALPASTGSPLAGVRIGVARDAAFAFLYPDNLALLERLGAHLGFFSPLANEPPPEVDSLYLPGGYPELHLDRLAEARATAAAIRGHHEAGKPIVAECGGMLYLMERLVDHQGKGADMLGLLRGEARMQSRLAGLALQSVTLAEGTLRGHTFHHSLLETPLEPVARGVCPNGRGVAEAVFRQRRLVASYVHFYLPSDPAAAAALFRP